MCIMIILPTESIPNENQQQRKLFLGCNWKCSIETTNEADDLCDNLNTMWQSLSKVERNKVELCVNPPYVFLDRVRRRLTREISIGGQNVYDAMGPNIGNTGTTTSKMLKSLGCESVLLGEQKLILVKVTYLPPSRLGSLDSDCETNLSFRI